MYSAASSARIAIRSDPKATSDAVTYPAIAAAEQVAAACAEVDLSVKAYRPSLTQYTVPTATSLIALSMSLYGRSGLARMDEIRANNPGKIPNPASIQAGTVLLLATPTFTSALV